MTQRIILPGEPRSKKNSSRIVFNKSTGQRMIIPSAPYKKYEEECGWYLSRVEPFLSPCNVKCLYFMATHRKIDLNNLLSASTDILVKYGILIDDNSEIVKGFDGSRVLYDHDNPRTEIILTEWEGNE